MTNIEEIAKKLEKDQALDSAFKRIDVQILTASVDAAKELFPYIHKLKEEPSACSSLIKKSWPITIMSVFDEMDRSGLSAEIARVAPENFNDFKFAESGELIEQEMSCAVNSGLSTEDIYKVFKLADEHKDVVFARMKTDGKNFKAREIARHLIENDPPGAQAAGGILAGVNLACALVPEPIISKGIAVASVVAGFIGALFGD